MVEARRENHLFVSYSSLLLHQKQQFKSLAICCSSTGNLFFFYMYITVLCATSNISFLSFILKAIFTKLLLSCVFLIKVI